jgi:branched-chain amino acid transport system substrate-binding protein
MAAILRTRRTTRAVAVAGICLLVVGPAASQSDRDSVSRRGNRTGVSPTRVKIGLHAPLTGPVPVPVQGTQKGANLYYKWRRARHRPIHGRHVRIVLKNDNGDAQQAEAVCREMAEEDKVFLLMAYGSVRPAPTCANYAAAHGIPYLSTGAATRGFDSTATYFATSLTFRQQAPLLADYLVSRRNASKKENAAVYFTGMGWEPTHKRFAAVMKRRHARLNFDRALSKNSTKADADRVVARMKALGVDHVLVLTTPIWFFQLLESAQNEDFHPLWTGLGPEMTTDSIPSIGCRYGTLKGARFLSPFPAVVDSNRFDKNFRRAVARFYPEEGTGDSFMWQGWATAKMVARMLNLAGRNLSRERFIHGTERADGLRTGITSRLTFSPKDHLGARSTHLLRAGCSPPRWHTARPFVRDF